VPSWRLLLFAVETVFSRHPFQFGQHFSFKACKTLVALQTNLPQGLRFYKMATEILEDVDDEVKLSCISCGGEQ
jgi:hypothetical protein